ncbi:MAG: hypothetical protein LCH20_00145 [Proteobacteria bacterium]|nr:hypothetical protein [Pseudomonadota bacterium]
MKVKNLKTMELKDLEQERNYMMLKLLFMVLVATISSLFFNELAFAKFDIDAGVAAATNPLIAGVEAHWGKGVLLTTIGAALWGEGDGRQRATRAGVAAGAAGAVVLGAIAMLK